MIKDWSEFIWEGVLLIVKEEVVKEVAAVGFGVDGGAVGDEIGWGVGWESVSINDQISLQLLQVPPESLALTFQYQVPVVREG